MYSAVPSRSYCKRYLKSVVLIKSESYKYSYRFRHGIASVLIKAWFYNMENNYNKKTTSQNVSDSEDMFLSVAKRKEKGNTANSRPSEYSELNRGNRVDPLSVTRTVPTVSDGKRQVQTAGRSIPAAPAQRTEPIYRSDKTNSQGGVSRNGAVSHAPSLSSPAVRTGHPVQSGRMQLSGHSADFDSTALYNKVPSNAARPSDRTRQEAPPNRQSLKNGSTKRGKGNKKNNAGYKGTAISSVLKAVIYIVVVIIIGGLIGFYGIMIGNDVFAFVKSEDDVEITIGENATTADIAEALKDAGVIRYPGIFKLYASLRHDTKPYVAGTYTVKPSMNYDTLRKEFHEKAPVATQVVITIPEGYTVDQIIDLFIENGIGSREGFVEAIQNYNFEGYWFLDELDPSPDRKYRLEGYLYPDTYYFYSTSSEVAVLYKLLDRFGEIFPEAYREECAQKNMTVDQLVILASMIQMEAKYESEYGWISSVFHNRLNNPSYETQGYLQSDATTKYGLDEPVDVITSLENQKDTPYNTYTRKGLPAGPITNPSYSAITWALYPADRTDITFLQKLRESIL